MIVRNVPLISFIAAPRVLGSKEATTIVTRGGLFTNKQGDGFGWGGSWRRREGIGGVNRLNGLTPRKGWTLNARVILALTTTGHG
jgi:hypothetical protein